VSDWRAPLTHQDVEDETQALRAVWDRLPEGAAAERARDLLTRSEEAAHRAVEGEAEPRG